MMENIRANSDCELCAPSQRNATYFLSSCLDGMVDATAIRNTLKGWGIVQCLVISIGRSQRTSAMGIFCQNTSKLDGDGHKYVRGVPRFDDLSSIAVTVLAFGLTLVVAELS
jgi:hypothetical protein